HAAEQGLGPHLHVEVHVLAAGGAHAERVPGLLHADALAGGDEEVGDPRLLGLGVAGGHEVGVDVPGAGDEGLAAADVEAAGGPAVGGGGAGEPRSGAALAHRDAVQGALGGRGEGRVPGGEERFGGAPLSYQVVGGLGERAGHGGA